MSGFVLLTKTGGGLQIDGDGPPPLLHLQMELMYGIPFVSKLQNITTVLKRSKHRAERSKHRAEIYHAEIYRAEIDRAEIYRAEIYRAEIFSALNLGLCAES